MIVTTKAEQNRAGRAARAVGGWDKLIRLGADYVRMGGRGKAKIQKNTDGTYCVVPVSSKEKP